MARRATFARGKWTGNRSINSITTDYRAFIGVLEAEAMRIMGRAADMQLDATLPLVPMDTGALRESGRAKAIKTSKGIAALVTFGGPDAQVKPTKNAPAGVVDYAAVVNYDMNVTRSIGGPMFLENGAAEAKDAVDSFIMSELKRIKP